MLTAQANLQSLREYVKKGDGVSIVVLDECTVRSLYQVNMPADVLRDDDQILGSARLIFRAYYIQCIGYAQRRLILGYLRVSCTSCGIVSRI